MGKNVLSTLTVIGTLVSVTCVLVALVLITHHTNPTVDWWCAEYTNLNINRKGLSRYEDLSPRARSKAKKEYELRKEKYYEYRVDVRENSLYYIDNPIEKFAPPLVDTIQESYYGDISELWCIPSGKPWLAPTEKHPTF